MPYPYRIGTSSSQKIPEFALSLPETAQIHIHYSSCLKKLPDIGKKKQEFVGVSIYAWIQLQVTLHIPLGANYEFYKNNPVGPGFRPVFIYICTRLRRAGVQGLFQDDA